MARTNKTTSEWNNTTVWIYDCGNSTYYKAIRHMIVNNNECVFAEVTASYECDNDTGKIFSETYKERSPHFYEIYLEDEFASISINENLSALELLISKEIERIETEKQCRKKNLINDIIAKLKEYTKSFSRDALRDRIKDEHAIEYLLSDIHCTCYSPIDYYDELANIIKFGGITIRKEDRDDAPRIYIPFSKLIEVSSYAVNDVQYLSFVRADGKTITRKSNDYLLKIKQAIHFLWENKVRF